MLKKPMHWVLLGLAVLVVVVYGQVAWHDWVTFDDPYYVYENQHVRHGFSGDNVQWAFSSFHEGHWHPLTWLSLMLDAQIYGQHAGGFHVTNLLFHVINVLLLLAVLRKMTGALWPSTMVAALFAVHPLHVESVAWVTERKDVLSTTFWMLTLLAYAAYAQRGGLGRYLLVALFLALGLMAKPMLVTLPCVLLLLDFWPLGRLNLGQKLPERRSILTRRTSEREPSSSTIAQAITSSHLEDTRRRQVGIEVVLVEKLPLLALSASASVIATLSQRSAGALGTLEAVSWSARLTNAFIAYVGYLWKMIWPVKLACYYPHSAYIHRDVSSSLSATVIASVLMLAIITYFVFYSVWRRPYLAVGWLWYLGTLVPVIGLVQIGEQSMADRFTYVPLVGIFILIVWGAADLAQHRSQGMLVATAMGVVLLAALTMLTWSQVRTWRNSLALYNHAILVTANNFRAHNYRGLIYQQVGSYNLALADYTKAIETVPTYPDAYNNRGTVYGRLGRHQLALADYARAIALDPDYVEAYNNRGLLLSRLGNQRLALESYNEAIRKNPDFALAYSNRGIIHAALGKYQPALADYDRAIHLYPQGADFLNNRGGLYGQMGMYERALRDLTQAIELQPGLATAYNNRGNSYKALRKYDLAMIDYAKAIELKPDFAEVYNNRGTLRGIMGKYDLALHDLTRAIELKPEDARSHDNLAWFMSTCPDPKFRNADRAMSSAIRACELLRWGDFHSLATLAAAHAAGGEFAEAVKWQTKALELTPAASKSELGSRLELYQSGKPYHQEPQK